MTGRACVSVGDGCQSKLCIVGDVGVNPCVNHVDCLMVFGKVDGILIDDVFVCGGVVIKYIFDGFHGMYDWFKSIYLILIGFGWLV